MPTSLSTRFALFSLAASALAPALPTPAAAQKVQMSREDRTEQGKHYYKKKLYKQAKIELDAAHAMKGGDDDFETVYYRALTCFELLLLEEANAMGQRATALCGGNAKRQEATEEFLTRLRGLYGPVTFKPAEGETNKRGRIFFEAKTGIINPQKRERFESIRERWRATPVELPATIFLPFGDYTANNVPFTVAADQNPVPVVPIFLQVIAEDFQEDEGFPWLWVGIGAAAAAGAAVGAYFIFGGEDTPDRVEIGPVEY